MIKSILGGKSKNLFDISKVITSNRVKRNGNSLICSAYGVPIGTLGSICPTLKASDLITISFKCASEGAPSNFMAFDGRTFPSGATFLVSEIGLSAQWYIYNTNYEHRDIPNKTTYSDIQLELGSTATEYVPHELTSYKSIMKVSDVMQVVNKPVANSGMSLIGKSITISGITCHYLEDGTGVTLTGTTSTAHAIFEFGVYKKPIIGHKYLWFYQHSNASDVINSAYIELKYVDKDGKGRWFSGTEQVYTLSEYAEKFEFHPIVKNNTTCNGFTFKPQFFDLTEMFGAGNEPKTVAEFKAKFPNDYYPYSPSCFVTSFDERMPCKTKNLFDIDNAVPFKFNDENPQSSQVSLKDRIYTTTVNNYNYGSGLKIKDKWVLPAGSYVVKADIVDFSATVTVGIIGWYYSDINGKRHYGANKIIKPKIGMQASTTSFNIPEGIQDFRVYLSWQNNNPRTVGFISYKDIQVMKSDITATDYVPYGYV